MNSTEEWRLTSEEAEKVLAMGGDIAEAQKSKKAAWLQANPPKEMNYTKGEWKATQHYNGSHWFVECGEGDDKITIVDELSEANAHIIAAAPIMHGQLTTGVNGLRKALKLIDAGQAPTARDYLCGIIAGNEIALAKVEGG